MTISILDSPLEACEQTPVGEECLDQVAFRTLVDSFVCGSLRSVRSTRHVSNETLTPPPPLQKKGKEEKGLVFFLYP